MRQRSFSLDAPQRVLSAVAPAFAGGAAHAHAWLVNHNCDYAGPKPTTIA